jgi:hypothetical protein
MFRKIGQLCEPVQDHTCPLRSSRWKSRLKLPSDYSSQPPAAQLGWIAYWPGWDAGVGVEVVQS